MSDTVRSRSQGDSRPGTVARQEQSHPVRRVWRASREAAGAGAASCAGQGPPAAVSMSGSERREYHGRTEVMSSGIVENAAAGYQPKSGITGRGINLFRRELRFEVLSSP